MFLFCLFFVSAFCNWSQLGHDAQNTFRSDYSSKNHSEWELKIDGQLDYEFIKLIMDDKSGLLWIFTSSKEGDVDNYYLVHGVDSETGQEIFTTKIDCGQLFYCGNPILTSDGTMTYYSEDENAILTINPDGSKGKWAIPNPNFGRIGNSVITKDDIFVFEDGFGTLRGMKFGETTQIFKRNISAVQLTDLTVSSKGNIYFTTQQRPVMSNEARVYVVDSKTGEGLPGMIIEGSTSNNRDSKFSVSSDEKHQYFVNNWLDDPMLLAMTDQSSKILWNYTFINPLDTFCGPAIILEDRNTIILPCEIFHFRTGSTYEFIYLEASTGKPISLANGFNLKYCPVNGIFENKKRSLALLNCGEFPKSILGVDVVTGEKITLVEEEKPILNFITDKSNCVFHCFGNFNEISQTCRKKCFTF